MRRMLLVVMAAGLLCAAARSAAPPPIQERLDRLAAKIKQAQKNTDFEAATRLAGQMLAMHEHWEGKHYWQTIDARLQLERWRRLRAVPAAKRAELIRALELTASGDEDNEKGHYAQAEKKHREAVTIYQSVLGEGHAETATGYYNLGESVEAQSKFADAMLLYKKSLAIRRKVLGEEHFATARSLDAVGGILYFQRKHAEAQPLLKKALAIYRSSLGEDHPITADGYNHVAGNLNSQGKYADAQPRYEKALAIRRRVRGANHTDTANGCNDMAYCLYFQGKYTEAQPLFEEALAIYRRRLSEDHPYTGTCYSNVAMNLNKQHRYAEAEKRFRTSLDILTRTLGPNSRNTAGAMNNLAMNLDAQGKYAQAQPLFEQARKILTNLLGKEAPSTAIAISNLAGNLQAQGKDVEARPLFEEALAIFKRKLGEMDPLTADGYHRLAVSLDRESDPARVQELLEKSLAIQKAVLVEDHPYIAENYHDLAEVLAIQGKRDLAKEFLEKALAIRKKMLGKDHPETASSDSALAVLLWQQGNKKEAVSYWQAACDAHAIARIDRATKGFDRSLVQGRGLSPDVALAAALAARDRPEAAFDHADSNLARGLLDSLGLSTPKDDPKRETLQIDKEKLDQQLVPLLGRGKLTPDERQQRDRLLARRSELVSQFSRQTAGASKKLLLSHQRIQEQIPNDGAIVLWIDAEPIKEHWGCVIRAKGPPRWQRLPGTGEGGVWTKADSSLPTRVLPLLSDPRSNPADLQRQLTAVRQQRLDPLRPYLTGVRQLFVVPVSPMEALPVEVLSEEYRISYIPSPSLYARAMKQHRRVQGTRLLALGDPVFTAKASDEKKTVATRRNLGYKPLPGTRQEVEALARMVPATKLLGSDASEQKLDQLVTSGKLKQFHLLHFATHGHVNAIDPRQSAIILAEDDRLTVDHILDKWNLDADLVVLSACQSGLGRQAGGEGLLGFAQAFLQKHARSVVVSRWKVDDTATTLLMMRFYENLLGKRKGTKPMGRAAALNEAGRWLRELDRKQATALASGLRRGGLRGTEEEIAAPRPGKEAALPVGDRPFAHPFFWAAFILVGDPE